MSEVNKLKEQLAQLKKAVQQLEKQIAHLEKGSNTKTTKVSTPQKPVQEKEIDNEPGITGTFDGFYMVTDSGEKHEVPANYAAKSRLVYGDKLKMTENDGKKFFKQVEKIPRRKIEGIINKKEGKWYFLSHAGSYKISDTAASYNSVKLNDEAIAYIPENNLNAPFATLDKVLKVTNENTKNEEQNMEVKPEKKIEKEPKKESEINLRDDSNQQEENQQTPVQPEAQPEKEKNDLPDNPRVIAEEDLR